MIHTAYPGKNVIKRNIHPVLNSPNEDVNEKDSWVFKGAKINDSLHES